MTTDSEMHHQTWIFQGNPDEFDIDGYLASRPAQVSWLVTRYAADIAIGDRVFLWRNKGKKNAISGIVAEGIITKASALRGESSDAIPFWRKIGERTEQAQVRTVMRLVKVATAKEVIREKWCTDDPILRELPNLSMRAATNYRISQTQALRIDALWGRTGNNWTRSESVAGLMAYAETYGQPISQLSGSPVARIALTIGRAVSSVYAKVMNFRSLDPRAENRGMLGAGDMDRAVWDEFFDVATSTIRANELEQEYSRLWAMSWDEGTVPPEAVSLTQILDDEAKRLEDFSLEHLMEKYAALRDQSTTRPRTRVLSTRAYERSSLVIAIARIRAAHKCEITDCMHPTFEMAGGDLYTEVHHIISLSSGGPDTIENVACLCPAHHREIHFGKKAETLTLELKKTRSITTP
jgi:hypothetical protein